MSEFPEWFYYSIKVRLELIYNQMKQDNLISAERIRLSQRFIALLASLSEEAKSQLLLLEES